jgi:hypothetical protein
MKECVFRPRLECLEDRSVPAVVGTPTENFVEQVYLDLLNRSSDPAGRAAWTAAIDSGQLTREQFALLVQGSEEGLRVIVTDVYQQYLGRAPGANEAAAWADFLRNGRSTLAFEALVLASDEYFLRAGGGTNQGFVNALYLDVLGRPADPAGLTGFTNQLNAGRSRLAVAVDFLRSPEGRSAEVTQAYQTFLRRPADPGGLAVWTNLLLSGGLDEAIDLDDGGEAPDIDFDEDIDDDDQFADDDVLEDLFEDGDDIENNTDAVFISLLVGSQEYFLNSGLYPPAPVFPGI